MRNLNYLNSIEIDEYNLIKNSKQYDMKNRLDQIQVLVVTNYNEYVDNFSTIQQIGPSTFNNQESTDLRSCYKIKTAARDSLLARIVNNQTTHFKHICPYCLLYPRTTYDHYIPEQAYPVFCVLPKNLIPCCITCNGKKLQYWRENGSRAILHYYNDLIPQTQFLTGSLAFNAQSVPYVSYQINQPAGVSNAIFSVITYHFNRLELIDRYEKHLDLVVSDIVDDVQSNRQEFGAFLTTQNIANIILNKANRYKQHYGNNYWKSIAMDLLGNSQQFLATL